MATKGGSLWQTEGEGDSHQQREGSGEGDGPVTFWGHKTYRHEEKGLLLNWVSGRKGAFLREGAGAGKRGCYTFT